MACPSERPLLARRAAGHRLPQIWCRRRLSCARCLGRGQCQQAGPLLKPATADLEEPATTPLPCPPLPIHRPSTSSGPTGLEEGEESREGRPPAPPPLPPVSYVSDCFLLRSWLRTFSWSRSLVICLVCRIKTFAVRSQSTFHISCSDYSVVLFGGVLIDTVAVSGRNSPC